MDRLLAVAAVAVLALAACTPPLAVDPAPHAADPECASVMLAVPDELGGLPLRATTSQATAAYGDEYPIVVRCGVEIPEPTTDPCFAIQSGRYAVDWVTQDVGEYRIAVSYGRDPALEVAVPLVRADQAVVELLSALTGPAAQAEPTGRTCVGYTDVQ